MSKLLRVCNKTVLVAVFTLTLFGSVVHANVLTNDQLIEQLMQQVLVLKQQLLELQGVSTASNFVFMRNLKVGDTGRDVLELQKILNTNMVTAVALSGSGSLGQETALYGNLTADAVRRFQEFYAADILTPNGLMTGTGFVGTFTRSKLNDMSRQVVTPRATTTPVVPIVNKPPVRRSGGGSGRVREEEVAAPIIDPIATTTPAAPLASCTIKGVPASVVGGASTRLTIMTKNAQSGVIDQSVGVVITSEKFEVTITPPKSARYTLSVKNADSKESSCGTEITVVPAVSNFGLTAITGQSCVFPIPPALPKQTYYWLDKEYATLNGETLRYDMSAPQVEGTYPLIMLIHGGAFQGKGGVTKTTKFPEALLRSIAAKGYVVAAVEYSQATSSATAVAGKNNFPEAIKDLRCAVRYFKSGIHTNLRFIDTDKVGVLGTSAGAHLALLLGTSESVEGFDDPDCPYNQQSVRVQSVAALYPSTRFRPDAERYQWSNYTNVRTDNDSYVIFGTQSNNVIELIKKGSPLYQIENYDSVAAEYLPPIMVVSAGREKNPALTASTHQLVDSLRQKNIPHIFFTEDAAYHGFDPFNDFRKTSCYTTQFFGRTLK